MSLRNDFYFRVAERRGGSGWKWHSWKVIGNDGDAFIEGAIEGGKTTGYSVSRPEAEAERARWLADGGKCAECMDAGQVWMGWSKADGHSYRPCACVAHEPAIARARRRAGEAKDGR